MNATALNALLEERKHALARMVAFRNETMEKLSNAEASIHYLNGSIETIEKIIAASAADEGRARDE